MDLAAAKSYFTAFNEASDGFGGEGDWKTSALHRVMKIIANNKGTSFMEEDTLVRYLRIKTRLPFKKEQIVRFCRIIYPFSVGEACLGRFSWAI